jgi:hypothetical protein
MAGAVAGAEAGAGATSCPTATQAKQAKHSKPTIV